MSAQHSSDFQATPQRTWTSLPRLLVQTVQSPLRSTAPRALIFDTESAYEVILGPKWFVALVKLPRVFCSYLGAEVSRIGPYVVKRGKCVRVDEAYASIHASKLGIPTPEVLSVVRHGDKVHIVTRYVRGATLAKSWSRMNGSQRECALSDLRRYISLMKNDVSTSGAVASIVGGDVIDLALWEREWECAQSQKEFVSGWLTGVTGLSDECIRVLNRERNIVFTHGDLAPHNIIVRSGKIVSIVDWESSGYFPEYWEHAKMGFPEFKRHSWRALFDEYYPEYTEEMEAFTSVLKRRSPY